MLFLNFLKIMGINKLSLGSVQWGSSYGISNVYGQTNVNEVSKILNEARQKGIRLIDTATSYGNAEEVLGKHNLNFFSIVTKIPKFEKNIIFKSEVDNFVLTFQQSLKKLNQSSCYGLLLHHKDDVFKKGSEYFIQVLNDLKFRGLVKKIGVSIYDSKKIEDLIEKLNPDIIQLPLNVLDQRVIQDGTLKYLKSKNIEIHARSVFLQGLLLMPTEKMPLFFKTWSKKLYEWKRLCFEKNVNFLEAALNFVIKQKNIDYCLVGVENLNQFKECILATKSHVALDFTQLACNDTKLINPINWRINE